MLLLPTLLSPLLQQQRRLATFVVAAVLCGVIICVAAERAATRLQAAQPAQTLEQESGGTKSRLLRY